MVRIIVLGGSGIATPGLAEALARIPGRTTSMELVLVGRSAGKLASVAAVTRMMAGDDPLLTVSHTTDIEAALLGADYVLNQVRVGGMAARAFDESFPQKIGLPGEETVGAGGFANASRTIPVVLEYARLVERIAPHALLLTLTNPSSLVQYAISRYTQMHVIGLCDMPVTMVETIARAVGVPVEELTVDYVGMHHFGWITGVWRQDKDLLPEVLAKAADVAKEFEPAVVQSIGAIPNAYLKYVFHPDRMLAKTKGRRTRGEELLDLQERILADYERSLAAGQMPAALAQRGARWYHAIIAPVLVDLVEGRRGKRQAVRHVLDVTNGQIVPWLPSEAVVEVSALVQGGRVQPLVTRPVPPDLKALVQANCAYEMMAVEAIVERDRAKALRALLLNPVRHTYDQAVAVVERAWKP